MKKKEERDWPKLLYEITITILIVWVIIQAMLDGEYIDNPGF